MKTKSIKSFLILVFIFLVLVITCFAFGVFWIDEPSINRYPVRGVDVSHYQGQIDWTILSEQKIQFAFIKATEGSGSTDKRFKENWDNIGFTNMKRGAYHFFSFDSEGKTQAENYISVVPITDGMLPPVVDIEYYGNKEANPPDVDIVRKELDILLKMLEKHYSQKPILYTTMKVYYKYIDNYYDDYPLWIRNTYYKPFLFNRRKWLFWQYSDKEILKGYDGKEKHIDMNIFNGDLDSFHQLFN